MRAMKLVMMLLVLGMASVPGQASQDQEEDAECETQLTEYNLGLAVGSVFILLAVSLLGSTAPLLLSNVEHRLINVVIKVGTFGGSGVIIATALVHCLLPANEYFTSPCLPSAWHNYEPMAFMLCTATIVLFQILDYCLAVLVGRFTKAQQAQQDPSTHHHQQHGHSPNSKAGCPPADRDAICVKHSNCHDAECGGRVLLAAGPLNVSQVFSLGLAELAIAFHSIIIGLALGVTSASEFTTLLVALCFHQFLEGFALGSAVMEAGFGAAKAYGLALFYSLSTPLGIAVGIGVRQSFNSNAVATLLVMGFLDSIAAGVLIHVVLGGPMNAMKACQGWLQGQGMWVHVLCFGAFAGGAAAMSLIGKWA